ncbi:MAG: tetratricopeptide repeat protein [Myxococcales bacterium]|nr:tetratricopeptide repeat protein [Myxococcales bacterium]
MHDPDDDLPEARPAALDTPDARDAARWEACEEGVELLHEGEIDEAIAAFEEVALQDPQNPYAFHFLGAAHFEREAWDKALAGYLRALQLAPQYLGARVGAGQTLRMMGQPERAIRMGKQALALRRDDPDALFLLGLCYYQLGERKPAYGFLQRFLATSPEVEVRLEVEGLLNIIRGEVFPGDDDSDGDFGDPEDDN